MKSVFVRATVVILGLIVFVTLLLPVTGQAQGRGHGRGLSKKSVKFVNGHDASEGRLDGRGPRRRLVRGRWILLPRRQNREWIRMRPKPIRRQHDR